MQAYEDLKQLVAEIEADINKAEGGNKAAERVFASRCRRSSRPHKMFEIRSLKFAPLINCPLAS